jgi:hypothetical protein
LRTPRLAPVLALELAASVRVLARERVAVAWVPGWAPVPEEWAPERAQASAAVEQVLEPERALATRAQALARELAAVRLALVLAPGLAELERAQA